jgi:transcriptional regulator with XRE-family HTH domain
MSIQEESSNQRQAGRRSPAAADDERFGAVDDYARRLGGRLRQIRLQKGLSLTAVESRTSKEFKASVLGAYERGERAVTVSRLMRLATCYGLPLEQLLPDASGDEGAVPPDGARGAASPMRIDLVRVGRLGGPEGELVRRQLGLLQLSRQDFNGRVMSLRRDDERVLAAIFGVREESIRSHLADLGLLTER